MTQALLNAKAEEKAAYFRSRTENIMVRYSILFEVCKLSEKDSRCNILTLGMKSAFTFQMTVGFIGICGPELPLCSLNICILLCIN